MAQSKRPTLQTSATEERIMEFDIVSRKDQDLGRGVALLVASAVLVLLKFVLPVMAPLALAAYGVYRLLNKHYKEFAVIIAVALLLWFLQGLLSWLMFIFGAAMAGFGIFFLIRALRGRYLIE